MFKGFSLIELMIALAIIGILMAMAIPPYHDYMVRARVTEGIMLATAAKLAVVEAWLANNEWPQGDEACGYTSPTATANVAAIHIAEQGKIIINYTKQAGEGSLILTPLLNPNQEIRWSCGEGTLPAKYRPAPCRI